MPNFLMTATIGHQSGLADEAVSNSFSIRTTDDPSGAELIALMDQIAAFYNDTSALQVSSVGTYLSPELERDDLPLVVRAYNITANLDGSPHGSPVDEKAYALDAAGVATALPSEVALCVTIEGFGRSTAPVEVADGIDPGAAPDRPKQRRTGRVFIGPLATNTVAAGLNGESRPSSVFRLDTMIAVRALDTHIIATGVAGAHLAVWSRANADMYVVEAVSVDDAWDTQRRRGVNPTARGRLAIP